MMTEPAETVILCEGYHDRAFWAGLLEDAGYEDARPKRANGSRGPAIDPFQKSVGGGDYAFRSTAGHFVRVRPCLGASKVPDRMKERLAQRATAPLAHLIVNLDTDASDVDDDSITRGTLGHSIRHRIRAMARDAFDEPTGDILIDDKSTRISIVLWSAPDPASPDLPEKQTLERLVCAALRDAYPDRSRAVADWLSTRPSPPSLVSKSYKSHAWLHMGAWYPEHGCDDFYRHVWRPGPVREALRNRMVTLLSLSARQRLGLPLS